MSTVPTARGTIDTSELGNVLMHEHIFVRVTEIHENYPEWWGDEEQRIEDAAQRLNELKKAGIDTIVDLTALGLGRFIPRIQRVAEKCDINVIVATGYYTFDSLPHYFNFRNNDDLVALFVRDIEEGITGTGIRAGVIKCATDEPGVTSDVERILRACAQAHRRTGVPISTHTHAATHRGREQQKIFEEEGVDLTRVVIGHCGDSEEIEYLEELMAKGSYIGMDRFGIESLLTTEKRVDTIVELAKRGHADQMVLGHDAACFNDFIPTEMPPPMMPTWNYQHISQNVLPLLREKGVTEEQITQMLVDNPRRYFEQQGSY